MTNDDLKTTFLGVLMVLAGIVSIEMIYQVTRWIL
jgi:hypothetical protein